MNMLNLLKDRGFVHQTTDFDELEKLLETKVTFYAGFDPTGESLHVGHLIPIMIMKWLEEAGHKPIVLIGGGTAKIGDPSGKDSTRDILDGSDIIKNSAAQQLQILNILGNSAEVVNNAEWLDNLNYVQFLRTIGKHFSVNNMLTASGIAQRLERAQGLSFIEFNYHLLQSYDYLQLFEKANCRLQIGGSDQWFNIVGGIDLVKKITGEKVFGLTAPLILTSSGSKMGKTEKGAVFLSKDLTSVFDFYQYWINVSDIDVIRFLKLYTFLSLDKIDELTKLVGSEIREAKKILAFEVTKMVHGEAAAIAARKQSEELFSGHGGCESIKITFPINIIDALVLTGQSRGKNDGRRLIDQGGISFNNIKIGHYNFEINSPGIIWKGKKHPVKIEEV